MTEAVFYVLAVSAVITALLCILSRSTMSAVLWLTATMLSLAAIYLLLNAEFVAAIQVLVYAGAVMVLFLFVVMLLNLSTVTTDLRGPASLAAAIVLVGLLGIQLAALWRYTPGRLAAEVDVDSLERLRENRLGRVPAAHLGAPPARDVRVGRHARPGDPHEVQAAAREGLGRPEALIR